MSSDIDSIASSSHSVSPRIMTSRRSLQEEGEEESLIILPNLEDELRMARNTAANLVEENSALRKEVEELRKTVTSQENCGGGEMVAVIMRRDQLGALTTLLQGFEKNSFPVCHPGANIGNLFPVF